MVMRSLYKIQLNTFTTKHMSLERSLLCSHSNFDSWKFMEKKRTQKRARFGMRLFLISYMNRNINCIGNFHLCNAILFIYHESLLNIELSVLPCTKNQFINENLQRFFHAIFINKYRLFISIFTLAVHTFASSIKCQFSV